MAPPGGLCPACWPAYAGVLSALGVGALMSETWVVPITVVGLAVAVGALGFRAQRRRGYAPLALGIVAAAAVLVGKFAVASSVSVYAGVGLLIGASVWNAWPARPESCAGCATTAAATPHG